MRIDIVSLFPPMFEAVLEQSILRRAQQLGRVTIEVHDLRDYAVDRHRSVDDRPYGGGPGMVLCPEPVSDQRCSNTYVEPVRSHKW